MFVVMVTRGRPFVPPGVFMSDGMEDCLAFAKERIPESKEGEWDEIRKVLMTRRYWADEATKTEIKINGSRNEESRSA